MHAVFPGLRLRYPLENQGRRDPLLGDEHRDVGIRVVVPIVEGVAPEVGQLLGLRAIEYEIHPRLLAHRLPPRSLTSQAVSSTIVGLALTQQTSVPRNV